MDMPIVRKVESVKKHGSAIISDKVKSHANDPFFIKKLEAAKATLINIALPKENY